MINKNSQKAFTLLEVLITLTILVGMMYAISTLLRSSIDMKFAVGQKDKITQKLNLVINRLSSELAHAYLVSTREGLLTGGKRTTILRIEKGNESDSLYFTYIAHKTLQANAKESELSYVVYKLQDAKKEMGRRHLYRGEYPRIPSEFREDPQLKLFVENVYSIKFEPWNGDDWYKDKWDTTIGETNNMLPQMIRIIVTVWADDYEEGQVTENPILESYSSIVYLPYALDFDEIKTRNTSFKL